MSVLCCADRLTSKCAILWNASQKASRASSASADKITPFIPGWHKNGVFSENIFQARLALWRISRVDSSASWFLTPELSMKILAHCHRTGMYAKKTRKSWVILEITDINCNKNYSRGKIYQVLKFLNVLLRGWNISSLGVYLSLLLILNIVKTYIFCM